MTRTWIAGATGAFGIVRPASGRRTRPLASVRLETLEGRLALSGFASGVSMPLIKHGALPTAVQFQPMIIGNHIGTNPVSEIKHGNGPITPQDLNPQPLPPGVEQSMREPLTLTPDPTCPSCAPHFMAIEVVQRKHVAADAATEIKHGNGPIIPQDLNPQPLPPGYMVSQATQGQHIGTNVMSTKFTVE